MFKDYIVIDDVLDDPDELVWLSRNISYYSKEKQEIDGIKIKDMRQGNAFSASRWRGYRSDFLHEIDRTISEKVFNTIVTKMISNLKTNINYRYSVYSHLHFAPALIPYHDSWWHEDSDCLFAGIVYLNKDPEPDSGTILKLNGNEIIIDNVFNRLVFYRSNIIHRPQKCFGDNIENCRLVLPMFFTHISISQNYE